MRTREQEIEPLVNLSEIAEIELLILKRMSEFTIGEHRSRFHGAGFDFVGLREWQPGDRFSSIDWAQSSLTNFNPIMSREFEQPSTASVVAVADASMSTRCGANDVTIAAIVARVIATIGMSAVFFQDTFGLMTFEAGFRELSVVPARTGKSHVVHCLDAYQNGHGLQEVRQAGSISMSIASVMRKTSLIPVISDFLFENPQEVLRELSQLNSAHDLFLILIDAAFAYQLPRSSAGWIEIFDVETGRSRVISRKAAQKLSQDARCWQDDIERMAKEASLDVLRLGVEDRQFTLALTEFIAERRLRKV